MNKDAGSRDPVRRVLELLAGKWLTAAISAAATLGIPDALADGPKSLGRLAQELGCEADALARLLRVLVGEELLHENIDREFELLPAGQLLRREAFGPLARYVGSPLAWEPWADLVHAVRTGESAFIKRHGVPLFEYLDRHPVDASLYADGIEAFARPEVEALTRHPLFDSARRVMDVGGGRGDLLIELLGRFGHLEGRLLERPETAREANARFLKAGLAGRCESVAGDFLVGIPAGADVCILKHIIHSWDDDTAVALLRRCGEAVGANGRVLIIEGILVRGGRRSLTNMLDLEMLVLCGPGHERSKPELRRLVARSGLKLIESTPLTETARLFVTAPNPRRGRE